MDTVASYIERLVFPHHINKVTKARRNESCNTLSVIGPHTYLQVVLLTYAELIEVLKDHFSPKPSDYSAF